MSGFPSHAFIRPASLPSNAFEWILISCVPHTLLPASSQVVEAKIAPLPHAVTLLRVLTFDTPSWEPTAPPTAPASAHVSAPPTAPPTAPASAHVSAPASPKEGKKETKELEAHDLDLYFISNAPGSELRQLQGELAACIRLLGD